MHPAFNEITYLVGNKNILESIEKVEVLSLFDQRVIDFLDSLSKKLLSDKEAKKYPDIVSYAFWIRKSSLDRHKEKYDNGVQRVGKGVVLHIAPSNIPIQFAVTLTYALIAGNASIIRVSNKSFIQVDIICKAIENVLNSEYQEMKKYICIVRYQHNQLITQALTDLCDIRMIWGGNETINNIRKCAIKPRCLDLGFADRYSIAVIHADSYLEENEKEIAKKFYNDTYYFDQNACSSPRMVIWYGKNIEKARMIFWESLEKEVTEKYSMEPIVSSEKLLNTAVCAMKFPNVKVIKNNNLLVRLEIQNMYEDILEYKGNCGYFFEYLADSLDEMVPVLKKECQTISYIGNVDVELREIIKSHGVRGVDRIVPVGQSGNLSFVWDGIDLPEILSRHISSL